MFLGNTEIEVLFTADIFLLQESHL